MRAEKRVDSAEFGCVNHLRSQLSTSGIVFSADAHGERLQYGRVSLNGIAGSSSDLRLDPEWRGRSFDVDGSQP